MVYFGKKVGGDKEETYPCDARVVTKPLQLSLTKLDFGRNKNLFRIFHLG